MSLSPSSSLTHTCKTPNPYRTLPCSTPSHAHSCLFCSSWHQRIIEQLASFKERVLLTFHPKQNRIIQAAHKLEKTLYQNRVFGHEERYQIQHPLKKLYRAAEQAGPKETLRAFQHLSAPCLYQVTLHSSESFSSFLTQELLPQSRDLEIISPIIQGLEERYEPQSAQSDKAQAFIEQVIAYKRRWSKQALEGLTHLQCEKEIPLYLPLLTYRDLREFERRLKEVKQLSFIHLIGRALTIRQRMHLIRETPFVSPYAPKKRLQLMEEHPLHAAAMSQQSLRSADHFLRSIALDLLGEAPSILTEEEGRILLSLLPPPLPGSYEQELEVYVHRLLLLLHFFHFPHELIFQLITPYRLYQVQEASLVADAQEIREKIRVFQRQVHAFECSPSQRELNQLCKRFTQVSWQLTSALETLNSLGSAENSLSRAHLMELFFWELPDMQEKEALRLLRLTTAKELLFLYRQRSPFHTDPLLDRLDIQKELYFTHQKTYEQLLKEAETLGGHMLRLAEEHSLNWQKIEGEEKTKAPCSPPEREKEQEAGEGPFTAF